MIRKRKILNKYSVIFVSIINDDESAYFYRMLNELNMLSARRRRRWVRILVQVLNLSYLSLSLSLSYLHKTYIGDITGSIYELERLLNPGDEFQMLEEVMVLRVS